ncbi:hypothetical protein BGZ49_001352 [Haplosporangium sp. Z 27]|nr:hypothetical protein BGZ49_001352 [Haplosporangium sp. Z 27]
MDPEASETSSLPSPSPALPSIQSELDTTKSTEDHRYSKKTRGNYNGHIERGKKYASEFGPDMAGAFDSISRITPVVLRAFVSNKCNENGYSYKTAEGIRSAFKKYFEETFGCQGIYWKCDDNGNWEGNPVFEPSFNDFMTSLKNRDGRSGTSKQSLAMSYQDMSKLMKHLQDSGTIAQHGEGLCLLFQAYAATGFTLWTRNDELHRLKGSDVQLDLRSEVGTPYLTIALTFRKTNQADASKANGYQIHPTPEEPHACCYTKLMAWLRWLEKTAHPLRQDDYVFPGLATDGRVKLKEPFSHTRIQALLDQFTTEAILLENKNKNSRYTSHCFRRGGVQHRFMLAKEKWSLKSLTKEVGLIGATLSRQLQTVAQGFVMAAPIVSVRPAPALQPLQPSPPEPQLTKKQKTAKHQESDVVAYAPRIPDISTWKDAVSQWENGDLDKGLSIPPKHWTVPMRRTDPSRYSQRKLIATEFIYLGRNDRNMSDVHGESVELVSNLIASIRAHKRARKK